MSFTVLYPDEERWKIIKKAALESVMRGSTLDEELALLPIDPEAQKDYLRVRKSYLRVVSQIEKGEVYDFYKYRRRFRRRSHSLSEFNRFKVVGILKESGACYVFEDGYYKEVRNSIGYKRCPFCNEYIADEKINDHLKARSCNSEIQGEEGSHVTVIFDKGIKTEYESLVIDCSNVRMLKKIIYDRTGISVSKQDVYRGDTLLKNSDALGGETVTVKQKKRTQRK
ncbi:hypothetical protein EHEL_080060 [Encephalitozoon hellem ATCC 50504]|uniref:Ubiquitin-like domain-containing protein n=1 Tax=Encephalitozoon hellem TaxID=27973 RepID=A0A9Q9C8Z9_ENCHE|nr:uncharacterized protein EHEL_080060 [Encephalitozoon hellem ATCC 50504]AFM98712.1 hypothetical protein EHEL_080060 [Encephalitozoon hellem ATCC 50504]UTX43685.1 hypothetical protein GPU96_08g14530 [Encephalitozoon hellem]|eukprot:XP_003887693.1 hypothetical protein EHEL_080060 [Encephalitozoon hellem ATCC 50504]